MALTNCLSYPVNSAVITCFRSQRLFFISNELNSKAIKMTFIVGKRIDFYCLLSKNSNLLNDLEFFIQQTITVISISRNGLLKSCARFVIERSEIRKKQHDFKSVHFECRMMLFYMIWEKSRLQSTFFPQNVEKYHDIISNRLPSVSSFMTTEQLLLS